MEAIQAKALATAKAAADAVKEELFAYHYKDVDNILKKLQGTNVVDKSLLENLTKAADYSALIYDFEKLCNNLSKDTELVVLSKEEKIQAFDVSGDPPQPDGTY